MGKARKRKNAKAGTESHSRGIEGGVHHSHDHEDGYEEAARQQARDELLTSEIACFIFLINKEEETTSLKLPVWLVETRFKKNWVLYHSSTIDTRILWNKSTSKPNNLKELYALKGDVNALASSRASDAIQVRSDLINCFSNIFSKQSKGKMGRIHNAIIVLDAADDIVPILRTFFIDSLPSIKRLMLHSVSYIFEHDDNDNSIRRGLIRKALKHFSTNIALSNAIFVLSNEQVFKRRNVDQELKQLVALNDRCSAKFILTKHFKNKTKENNKIKARSDFEYYAYSRWVATQVMPSVEYFKYGIDGKSRESTNPDRNFIAMDPLDLPVKRCEQRRIILYNSLDMVKFSTWLDNLFKENTSLLRVKGQVAFQGSGEKYIVQGLSGFWGCEARQHFRNERRKCRLVFIAAQFNSTEEDMKKSLESCIAKMSSIERFYWFYESETYLACLIMFSFTLLWLFFLLLSIDQGYLDARYIDIHEWGKSAGLL